ncbi:hypothetical protein G6F68_021667 [Rhizopus microsporus]|nr:hypothetical protein G6F68_021667 [Rhizopus microsporus]
MGFQPGPWPAPASSAFRRPIQGRGMSQNQAAAPTLSHNATISTAPALLRGFAPAESIHASAWPLHSSGLSA